MKKLLFIGDAVCASGFARGTHHYLAVAKDSFEVQVCGLNYHGKPHSYPYEIWPASYQGRDWLGVAQSAEMAATWEPDVIVIQNDPWNIPRYMDALRKAQTKDVKIVGVVAVDGKNCRGNYLNGLDYTIFWTKFGEEQARLGGFTGRSTVIPLGVDTELYKPRDKQEARLRCQIPYKMLDRYFVGCINRNQPRKRLDITIAAYAEWVKEYQIQDGALYLHLCPTGDNHVDAVQLMKYYGIQSQLIYREPEIGDGVPEAAVALTHNMFDVHLRTSQAEGWDLPALESMASGVPVIAGDHSALGDWARNAAILVDCREEIACSLGAANTMCATPIKEHLVMELDNLYVDRGRPWQRGIELANRPEYRWKNIGERFTEVVMNA